MRHTCMISDSFCSPFKLRNIPGSDEKHECNLFNLLSKQLHIGCCIVTRSVWSNTQSIQLTVNITFLLTKYWHDRKLNYICNQYNTNIAEIGICVEGTSSCESILSSNTTLLLNIRLSSLYCQRAAALLRSLSRASSSDNSVNELRLLWFY